MAFENGMNILLKPDLSQALINIAHQEGQTLFKWIEKVLQEAIDRRQAIVKNTLSQQIEALERIKQHRAEILASRGEALYIDVATTLDEIREERDANFFTNGAAHCH
ncbi:MAG: hypothetical protein ABFS56_31540 [Pseudomonadota bacterium]